MLRPANVAVVIQVLNPEAWNTPTSWLAAEAAGATVTVSTGEKVTPRSVE